jgi:uncharacterized membrane protein (UPF0127 family)
VRIARFWETANTLCKGAINRASRRNSNLIQNSAMKIIACLFLALLFTGHTLAQETPQTQLPRITLTAGIHQMDIQVALTPEQHQVGLMYRSEMPQNEGMLFVFQAPSKQCFWMKNTNLPLTAAFIADDGSIVNLEDMKPQTTDSHCSLKPVRYVLEMNQGWFGKKGLKAGSKLAGRPFSN